VRTLPLLQEESAVLVVVVAAAEVVDAACRCAKVVGGPASPHAMWSNGMCSAAALEASAKRPVPIMLLKCMLKNCMTQVVRMSEDTRTIEQKQKCVDESTMKRRRS